MKKTSPVYPHYWIQSSIQQFNFFSSFLCVNWLWKQVSILAAAKHFLVRNRWEKQVWVRFRCWATGGGLAGFCDWDSCNCCCWALIWGLLFGWSFTKAGLMRTCHYYMLFSLHFISLLLLETTCRKKWRGQNIYS